MRILASASAPCTTVNPQATTVQMPSLALIEDETDYSAPFRQQSKASLFLLHRDKKIAIVAVLAGGGRENYGSWVLFNSSVFYI